MRYTNLYKIAIVSGLCILNACDDSFLDRYPLDSAVTETYWSTEDQLRSALYPCYNGLQYDLIINMGDACGETVVWGDLTSGLSKVGGGKSSSQDNFPFYNYWRDIYSNIYTCNNFLDNYNQADIPQEVKDRYAADVKVIRAMQYFWLTTVWGDVPLIDYCLDLDEGYGPRDEKEKVIDWMIDELQWAAAHMSEDIMTGRDLGRINKWGALALLARTALQSGRYELAATTALNIMQNSPYSLNKDYSLAYHLAGDFEDNPENRESIIFSMYKKDVRMHNLTNYTCTPVNYIRLNASKTFVDAFLCSDGKPAIPGLEYYGRTDISTSEDTPYPVEHYKEYFQNRDPRMAMTLYCPGDAWPGGDDGDAGNRVNATFGLPRFASLQDNNNNGANTRTGFYFKKYNTPELAGMTNQSHNNINVIRYAEILLIYAEALYQMNGTLTQAQIDMTINRLRTRVEMHPMKLDELNSWNLDLWTELKRERRIEMSFDGMRYFDLLRWKEGWRLGRAITGPSLEVCLNDLGASPYVDDKENPIVDEFGDIIWDASKKEGGERYFDENRHYLWPVPYAEILKNKNLTQNPGW